MVCEQSTEELKKRQRELRHRTLWLKEMKEGIQRKTQLCMCIMAGIFFLLVMIQNSVYVIVPMEYRQIALGMSRYGKWLLILMVIILHAVMKDSEMEGV